MLSYIKHIMNAIPDEVYLPSKQLVMPSVISAYIQDFIRPKHPSAVVSEDGQYRYMLTREWDRSKQKVGYIMLNPSTADANNPDRTITKIMNITKNMGYGGLIVTNLYAYRTPYPRELKKANYPEGPHNRRYIELMLKLCPLVIYAWGDGGKEPAWLSEAVKNPLCLKLTKKGSPNHPLYLKKNTIPFPFIR